MLLTISDANFTSHLSKPETLRYTHTHTVLFHSASSLSKNTLPWNMPSRTDFERLRNNTTVDS
jgi:hypothetical protein